MADDSLPAWPGAAECYSRAYRLLASMAAAGHVEVRRNSRGRAVRCSASAGMDQLIEALNRGDEETVKGLLLLARAPLA